MTTGERSQIERQPIRHLGQPAEIAEAALMLAGEGASYMTGQTITIDGGYLLSVRFEGRL